MCVCVVGIQDVRYVERNVNWVVPSDRFYPLPSIVSDPEFPCIKSIFLPLRTHTPPPHLHNTKDVESVPVDSCLLLPVLGLGC